jgi:transcriptional regulator with XRE-family HTH domain
MQTRSERIAKRIEAETTRPRLSKKALAEELGISRPAFDRRLHGKPAWRYDELEKLAKLFGTTIDDLAGEPNEEIGENNTSVTADP